MKTTLPPPGIGGAALNGTAVAYIEPIDPPTKQKPSRSRSRSISPPPQQQNRLPTGQSNPPHRHRHHRRHHTIDSNSQSLRVRSKNTPTTTEIDEAADDETKQYLKMLVDEMQSMKLEMNKLRQTALGTTKGRSDSLQIDLKEIRSHIDHIRSRMAMTPRIVEKPN